MRDQPETLSSVTSGRRRRHGKVGEGAKKTKGGHSLAVAGSRPPNPAAPLIPGRLSHSSTDFAVLLGGLQNGGRIRIFPQGLGQQHGCSRGVRIPDLIPPFRCLALELLVSAFLVRFVSSAGCAAISFEMQRYPVLSSHLDGACSNHCVICGRRCWEFVVAVRMLWLGSGFFVQRRLFVPVVSANKGRVSANLPKDLMWS